MKFLGACSAFSFLGRSVWSNLLPCCKCILKYLLPTEGRLQTKHCWSARQFEHFLDLFFPLTVFSLVTWNCMMGPTTDCSLVCMSFWIQLSPNHTDLSVRFTSKYIKNAHFVLFLRRENQGTTEIPVPPLFSLWYFSEIQAHESWQIQDLSPSLLGCTWAHFSQGMTSTNSLPSPPRQDFVSPFLLMLYAAAIPNITPANPPQRTGVSETAGRWDDLSFRAQYSEYFVPYPQ